MEPLYHPITARQLAAIKPKSGSYIFVGQSGSGRRLASTLLAQRLNCSGGGGDACGICQNVQAGSFADVAVVEGTPAVGIDQIMQLQQILSQRPFSPDTTRLVIIEADGGISLEAQNRLLKTLEEPPSQTILILLTSTTNKLLETVNSRCQVVQFLQPSPERIQAFLTQKLGEERTNQLLQLQPTSIGDAISFATNEAARLARQSDLDFAREFLGAPQFRRLVLAAQIKTKARAIAMVELMARLINRSSTSLVSFNALERTHNHLLANVAPRASLEALALAL